MSKLCIEKFSDKSLDFLISRAAASNVKDPYLRTPKNIIKNHLILILYWKSLGILTFVLDFQGEKRLTICLRKITIFRHFG